MDGLIAIFFIYFIALIFSIGLACIFGFITQSINESKGYYGGFAWGFWLGWIGIIVVACKPDNNYQKESIIVPANKEKLPNRTVTPVALSNGNWQCSCGRINPGYVSSCVCGNNKSQVLNPAPAAPAPAKPAPAEYTTIDCAAIDYTTVNSAEQDCVTIECGPADHTAKERVPVDETQNIIALKEYKALLDSGVITQEEFEKKKKDILSR